MFQNLFIKYLLLVGILGLILLIVNYILTESPKLDESTDLNYEEKSQPFECGFDSFKQTKYPISITFIIISLLFLPFDLEIVSILPYVITSTIIQYYGLAIFLIFILILVIGFIFELNSNAISLFKFIKTNTSLPIINFI